MKTNYKAIVKEILPWAALAAGMLGTMMTIFYFTDYRKKVDKSGNLENITTNALTNITSTNRALMTNYQFQTNIDYRNK